MLKFLWRYFGARKPTAVDNSSRPITAHENDVAVIPSFASDIYSTVVRPFPLSQPPSNPTGRSSAPHSAGVDDGTFPTSAAQTLDFAAIAATTIDSLPSPLPNNEVKPGCQEISAVGTSSNTEESAEDALQHASSGHLLSQAGDFEAARRAFEKALGITSDLATAQAGLAGVLAQQGHHKEALEWAKRAVEADSSSPGLQTNLGYMLVQYGHLAEATSAFETALRLDATTAAAHVGLGLILEQKGDINEAIARARVGVELAPEATDMRTQLGHFLLLNKSYSDAAAEFRRVLIHMPNHSAALDGLRLASEMSL